MDPLAPPPPATYLVTMEANHMNGKTSQTGRSLEKVQKVPTATPCGSGWTGDRCTKPLGHKGLHSNESRS